VGMQNLQEDKGIRRSLEWEAGKDGWEADVFGGQRKRKREYRFYFL